MTRSEWKELHQWVRRTARDEGLRTLSGRCATYICHGCDLYLVLAERSYSLRQGQYRWLRREVDQTGAWRQPRAGWWDAVTGRLMIPPPSLP
jgi:hypothetical protein